MTQVYLIRHGESEANSGTGVAGDSPLTPRGVAQAQRLHDRLAATREIVADVLITSPLQRARHTAEIIAPALGLPLTFEDELVERRVGAASGVHVEEVRARWPLPDYAADPRAPWAPESESPFTFQARVSRELARLVETHAGKRIAMVCHAGVISAAMLYFQGLDQVLCALGTAYPLPEHRDLVGRRWLHAYGVQNASITLWRLADRRTGAGPTWYLQVFNDATHLRDLEAAQRLNWAALAPPAEESTPIAAGAAAPDA